MRRRNILVTLLILPLLSCSFGSVQKLGSKEPILKSEKNYQSYLALEYLQFSRYLSSIGEGITARYFGSKGLDVANGIRTFPESPIKWDADPQQRENMVFMQKRLEILLNFERMKTYLPIQMAHLTYLYDCWITRESSAAFIADDLAKCRVRFIRLLEEVERYADDFEKDKQSAVKIEEPKFRRFDIVFDLDSYVPNARANHDLWQILKFLKTMNGRYRILLVGNADRSGTVVHNQSLAQERVGVVKTMLTQNGVMKNQIEVRAYGEDFPDLVTQDGMQQISNRTVGVYVVEGNVDISVLPLPLIENLIYRDEIIEARKERGLE